MSGAAKLLHQLRDVLAQRGLDGFYLTRADRFQGEEVQPADEYLAYLTGFTGSAGIGLVRQTGQRYLPIADELQISRQTDKELYETLAQIKIWRNGWLKFQRRQGQAGL